MIEYDELNQSIDVDIGVISGDIEKIAEACLHVKQLVILTGAGVSAESGIPTFRDIKGTPDDYDVTTLASPDAFEKDPAYIWKWYDWRRQKCATVRPNAGHQAIADLEQLIIELGGGFTLITQNVDNLHRFAGSKNIIELHGNIWKVRVAGTHPEDISVHELLECPFKELPPRDEFGRILRPHIIWFGEMLSPVTIKQAQIEASKCDMMIVAGTSGVVYPASELPYMVMNRKKPVFDINPGFSEIADKATLAVKHRSGIVFPAIVDTMKRLSGIGQG
jgi:NAD-dependent deacetylase